MSNIDKPPPPPSTTVALGDAEQSAQVAHVVTKEKDHVVNSTDPENPKTADAKKPQGAVLSNYLRIFTFGTRFDFFLMFLSSISSIGAGIALPLMNIVFGELVGVFNGYFLPNPTVSKSEFQHEVNRLSLFMVYLFIGKFVLSYISMLAIRISGLRISAALRLAYLRATFAQPVSVIDTISPGKVSTRITTSSNLIQLAISQHFAMMFQSVAFTVGLYVVSFIKSWLLTLVASAALPFIVIVYSLLAPPFIRIQAKTGKHHEEASAMAFEIFSSIRIVTAFGAEKKLADQHGKILETAAKNERRTGPLFGLLVAPSMIAQYGMFGLTFWFGIKQYTEGHIDDIGDIVVVLFSVMTAVLSIGRLATPFIAAAKAATAATEILATIDAPAPDTSGLKDPEISADTDITFEDVKFSYPSRPDVQILHGLDATFPAGKVTAIVGPSGSGKSTVVGMVQRWYDLLGTTVNPPPTYTPEDTKPADTLAEDTAKSGIFKKSKKNKKPKADKGEDDLKKEKDEEKDLGPNTCTGTIRIGDTDVRKVDLKWWRSQIGLVQQEPFLFNDTLYNNVCFGLCGTPWENLPKDEKMAMVKEACHEAHAEEFISKLPEGYDTLVGEQGIKLSGGQRQRIAIARSIIKKPSILILDEATSAIDVRTERIVQAALDRVSKDRTTIVIAHRLSTIRRADKIMVLRQGKLVEEGTHDELLQIEAGIYYGLVHAQDLAMEVDQEDFEDGLEKTKTIEIEKEEANERTDPTSEKDPAYKDIGLFHSFCKVIYEQRKHWMLFLIAFVSIVAAGAVYPLQAYIFAKVVTIFSTHFGDDLIREGNFWSGMFGVEAAGVGLAYFALGYASHLISIAVTLYYRQEYLTNILKKRIPFFDTENHSPGSLTSSVSADVEQLQQIMSTEMSLALIGVFNLLGSIVISFIYGWKLSLVSLFAALPPILVAGYLRFRLEIQFEKMNAKIFANSSQFATEAVGAFRTVLSLTMETMIGDRYHELLKSHVSQAFGSAKFGTLIFAASDSVDMACMALSFWYGGTLLASREYDPMEFFVIYMAIVQGAVAAGTWFAFAPNLAQAAAASNRILGSRSTSHGPSNPLETPRDAPGGGSVEFQNVYFTYQSREVPVLSKLNLKVGAGQFAALVGASGCGKSTTISLLERFYEVDSGQLLYNDQDVKTLEVSEYRKHISLVSQEPTLYEGTIRDNILLSVEKDSVTDAEVEQVCQDAQIHEFISSLPEGYATRLGPKGMSLSGGQKQRLSLARALLRNPKLLLLDEATSSLDSESEKLVQAAIERAADGRTVIAVAHRLATIQKADVIYVMGSGKVLEQGDHNTLLKKKGVYWQMCKAQALDR